MHPTANSHLMSSQLGKKQKLFGTCDRQIIFSTLEVNTEHYHFSLTVSTFCAGFNLG